MEKFDDDGTGEIDFRKFCTFVMGSTSRDATSILDTTTSGRRDYVSADGGNSEMMLFRKVRMSAKGMRHAFRDIDRMGRGTIPMDDFKYVLHRYDINMGERQFRNLMRKIGASSSSVNWRSFMDYFKQDIAR
jgi:Ca2+-binding EF-hand superfamily protein